MSNSNGNGFNLYGLNHPCNGLTPDRKQYYDQMQGLSSEQKRLLVQQELQNGITTETGTRMSSASVQESKQTDKATTRRKKKEQLELNELRELGYDPKTDDPENQEPVKLSNLDLFEYGLKILDNKFKKQLKVVYDSSNEIHGGIVFGMKRPLNPSPGLVAPQDFRYYKTPKHFIGEIAKTIAEIKHSEVRDYWSALFDGMPYTTKIARNAKFIESIEHHKSISIDGNCAFKFIPKLEWFSPEVRSINPYDLLAILPKAEADMFMLHLGRLASGAGFNPSYRDNEIIETEVTTSYRYACLLNGEPQLGKSALFSLIQEALTPLGYSFGSVSEAMNQFSFSSVANVSGIFVDDSSEIFINKIVSSAAFKSITAGMPIVAEVKGVQNPSATNTSACIFISGNFSVFPQVKDSGVRSRLKVLNTLTMTEIENLSKVRGQDMRTYHFFKETAERLGIPMKTLTLYLLRVSLDKYLAEIGVRKVDGTWQQGASNLENKVKDLEKSFRFQYKEPAEVKLPIAARKAIAMSEALVELSGSTPLLKPEEFDDSFSPFSVIYLARTMAGIRDMLKELDGLTRTNSLKPASAERDSDAVKLINLKEALLKSRAFFELDDISHFIWAQVLTSWNTSIGLVDAGNYNLGSKIGKGVEELWDFCVRQVTLKNGTKINQNRPDYDPIFQVSLRNETAYKQSFKEIWSECSVDFSDPKLTKFVTDRLVISYYFCE